MVHRSTYGPLDIAEGTDGVQGCGYLSIEHIPNGFKIFGPCTTGEHTSELDSTLQMTMSGSFRLNVAETLHTVQTGSSMGSTRASQSEKPGTICVRLIAALSFSSSLLVNILVNRRSIPIEFSWFRISVRVIDGLGLVMLEAEVNL